MKAGPGREKSVLTTGSGREPRALGTVTTNQTAAACSDRDKAGLGQKKPGQDKYLPSSPQFPLFAHIKSLEWLQNEKKTPGLGYSSFHP